MSVTPACATGIDAAKTPAKNRANIKRGIVLAPAMTRDESAAPNKHNRNVLRRPILADKLTIKGQQTIWAMENALVDNPIMVGEAPKVCKCSGKKQLQNRVQLKIVTTSLESDCWSWKHGWEMKGGGNGMLMASGLS
eukprot:scaffold25406_cov117-Cylindrotheca_fusiformis.AAC.5